MNSSQFHGTSTSSSLRPRNKRLISIEDDDDFTRQSVDLASGPKSAPLTLAETSSSVYGSRSASPQSSLFGSRASSGTRRQASRDQTRITSETKKWGLTAPTPTSAGFLFSPRYWGNSWSSIQDVATTLLGTEIRDPPRSATLPRSKHTRQTSRYGGPVEDEWGPTIRAESRLAAGSEEDRRAQIQARKRQALLTANGYNSPDARGKYKRKLSVDETETNSREHSEDALVYVHLVKPDDSVMGIAIKYGCSETIVRKANRLWTNDSIQLRRLAYLPIDACTVKGRKIDAPANIDRPTEQEATHDILPPTPNSHTDWSIPTTPKVSQNRNQIPSPSISATTTSNDLAPPHIHDSWVQIAGFPSSTEIARLPRRALGFFPPARRKSIPYHDTIVSGTNSPVLSPSDLPPIQSNIPYSPALFSPVEIHHGRARAASSASTPNTIASALCGPGGVGTLGVEARTPGPAQDKLNTFFATHFPNAAIPILTPSNIHSRRTSFDSIRSGMSTPGGSGLEQIGGKVETWVRKLAAKGMKELSSGNSGSNASRRGSASQLINAEVQGDGDLIELMDGMDLVGNGDFRGPPAKGKARVQESQPAKTTTRSDDPDALRERFPVGGRVFDSVRK